MKKILVLLLTVINLTVMAQCPTVNVLKDSNVLTLQLLDNKPLKIGEKMIVAFSDTYISEIFTFNDYFKIGNKYIATFSTEISESFPYEDKITLFINGGVCFCEKGLFIDNTNIDYKYDYGTDIITFIDSDYVSLYDDLGNLVYNASNDNLNISLLLKNKVYFIKTSLDENLIKILRE